MKKNLIALAVFSAFSGAALAQSSVTLYGIIDVNFQYNDPNGTGSSTRGINSGHQSGSRWGVRGSEALSPGLNAVFTLEGGYAIDTGITAQDQNSISTGVSQGRLFGRQAWGGLSGGWGTLVAGRVATFSSGTGSFDMFGSAGIDPFATGFGDSSLGSTFTSSLNLRLDNSVLYRSPSFGGFQFGAGYSFNATGPETAGNGNNNRVLFLGANFASGPFYAAVTYDIIETSDAGIPGSSATATGTLSPRVTPGASDQKHLQIGGAFDLKFLKIHAAYAKEDSVYLVTGLNAGPGALIQPDAGADADAWMVGISAPILGGTILASYQTRDGDPVSTCLTATVTGGCPPALPATGVVSIRERDRDVWAIGYTYPFSRRTNVYINYSDSDEELYFQAPGAARVDQQRTGFDRKQYTVGLRHLF